ncbi:MAG: DUF5700 domain-containing putative Zn-dependent protease [Candidatus Eiseniibacteriota bacterium]
MGPARLLDASDIQQDLSPTARVLALWNMGGRQGTGDGRSRAEAKRIAALPGYRTLRQFVRDQFRCITSEDAAARALELPDSGACGFGMDPAFQARDSIVTLALNLAQRKAAISSRIASEVAPYLPAYGGWKPIQIWFVLGSQTMFDAATLGENVGGQLTPVVLVNLTEVLTYGPNTEERLSGLRHVLAHETFHAALHQVEPSLRGWDAYAGAPKTEFAHIREVMIDEGMAHYIDWRTRPEADSIFTWKPSTRENYAFAQLAIACKRLKAPGASRGDKLEMLQLAGTGPLWSKYGAISGMFAAYRIEMAYGRATLRRVVEEGPESFLRTYAQVAKGRPGLNPIPQELIYSQ